MRKPFRMSFAAAILLIAQSVAPAAAEAPAAAPVAAMASVRASATVLRPALISFSDNGADENAPKRNEPNVQRQRDAQGTIWIEFS